MPYKFLFSVMGIILLFVFAFASISRLENLILSMAFFKQYDYLNLAHDTIWFMGGGITLVLFVLLLLLIPREKIAK